MRLHTFQRDITFNKVEYDQAAHDEGRVGEWRHVPVTKTATFQELDQNVKEQHYLHFDIMGFYASGGQPEEEAKVRKKKVSLDTTGMYDLTVQAIKELLVVNEAFTAKDKEEFLSDSKALLNFAFWYNKEKVSPFFRLLSID